ncbi:class I SAM-dependent methyltransferase [Maritimibacter sp. UBA3975]|uniref:class I SAM-dependent methyltransferase n=1 Tax=Maritimibacter sp. UBA3975 TaxID=1946833 RepID=UPI000C0AA7B9|nr:class I SAM-dependent methyltransferase [Maritimibacter sp. UBA3975]MAM63463.1 SAM-dependent methyltransferase [Maritimibacter sp.]|tara:strand:- start:18575 stop:19189 length:615 start_codon:yes stop_codon:yes gene_type:complete
MTNQARVWDRFAKKYVASPIDDVAAYEHKLELTRKYLRPDMKVLEFGCGSGNTARLHAPHVASYTAMDISAKMIAHGRAVGPVPENMSFKVADFATAKVTPEAYDMILALSVLHVLPDPGAVVRKVAGALKPGGFFVSSTVPVGEFGLLSLIAPVGGALGVIPKVSRITTDDIRTMMTDAGLTIVEDWRAKPKSALFLIAQKSV